MIAFVANSGFPFPKASRRLQIDGEAITKPELACMVSSQEQPLFDYLRYLEEKNKVLIVDIEDDGASREHPLKHLGKRRDYRPRCPEDSGNFFLSLFKTL